MPAWSPGAYGIRNEWRNVQEFSATDETGATLKFEKVDKQTWRINAASGRRITARYKLYYRGYNDDLRQARFAFRVAGSNRIGGRQGAGRIRC